MDQVLSPLLDFPLARFLRVEAEEQPEISEAYSVSAVPYFVLFKIQPIIKCFENSEEHFSFSDGKAVDTLEGADPSSLANKELAKENGASPRPIRLPSGTGDELKKRLQQLVNSHPIMLFMKGSPESPKCGFSQKVVDILKKERKEFNEVREGLKKFANWPTFPQLYCKGELLGGCDIAIAMHESGELGEIFRDHGIDVFDSNEGKLTEPDSGKGGIVEASGLSTALSDRLRKSYDEVRQGLKVYSNWSSYPQLYIKGELIGGSDIVLEMQKSGELNKLLAEKGIAFGESLEDRLKRLINSSAVMLFMKGTPDAPRCGFSSKVVNALKEEGLEFGSFDILTDEEVRQGLKTFSNWPTFPQLYYKGELIGGCDIVLELHNNGELKVTLSE
ncbi:UNVERIFIED_CONTAM: Monothiol glutaredoxin-S17 [Sesamum radiatum]|uniref:Monothiol glutaredoxin-S17 n=1 Tax=Sesamum radiatum TaxID=300843 RepID=A0AAW2T1B3_SESRA